MSGKKLKLIDSSIPIGNLENKLRKANSFYFKPPFQSLQFHECIEHDFSPIQPIHMLRKAYLWDSCFWGVGKISVQKHCANLIGTSWNLVAQHATSVTASLIKIRVNKLHPCFGSRGSEVQILSPRPFKTMGYGLDRSPLFVWGGIWGGNEEQIVLNLPLPVIE